MRKISFVFFVLVLLSAVNVFASSSAMEKISFDLSGLYGSEPASGFGSTLGFVAGASADFDKFFRSSNKFTDNLKFRTDISYLDWDQDILGVSVDYRRIPIFLGGRLFFPIPSLEKYQMRLFAEAGPEISFDKVEGAVGFPPFTPVFKSSTSETHLGLTIGGGMQFDLTKEFFAGLDLRYHIITDSYFTMAFGVGYKF